MMSGVSLWDWKTILFGPLPTDFENARRFVKARTLFAFDRAALEMGYTRCQSAEFADQLHILTAVTTHDDPPRGWLDDGYGARRPNLPINDPGSYEWLSRHPEYDPMRRSRHSGQM